jgi:predicted aspartyl protease
MPTSQSRTRALAALCLACAPAAAGAAEIPYREAWGYAVVVPVHIQGLGPFDFLFDTGTDVTVVHPDLARRIGLVPTSRTEVATVGGSRLVPQAAVRGLSVGSVTLGPMDVLIHDLAAARAEDRRLFGILGHNALRGMSFTIDHARRRIVVREAAGAVRAVADTGVEGAPTIEARLRCAGEPIRLVLDSGIGGIVLFAGAKRLPVALTDRVTARTNLGTAALRAGRLEALCVGSARLVDVTVAVQEKGGAGSPSADGLLPTRLFARVHFDAQRDEVRVEPW